MRLTTFAAVAGLTACLALPAAAETLQVGPYTVDVTKLVTPPDSDTYITDSYVVTGKELKGLSATGDSLFDALSDYTDLLLHKGHADAPDLTNMELPKACGTLGTYDAKTGDMTLREFPGLVFHQPLPGGNPEEEVSADSTVGVTFLQTKDPQVKLVLELNYICAADE